MKYSSTILRAAVLSSIFQASEALVGLSWSVSDVSSSGMTDITFPISMPDAAHKSGYYFAQQFNFEGQSDVGYTGLQPREDNGSQPVIHGVFSSFISGTTTDDSNCSDGADGGAGVSCSVDVTASYAHGYLLKIQNTSGTTWTGTLVDAVTGTETHIGSYTLPSGSGGIKGSQVGFVEYYPWNSGTHTCDQLPKTSVTFGAPTTSSGNSGSLGKPYEYGDCVGKVDFSTKESGSGYEISVGF
ncbi:hypothetical protein N7462_006623 [Penicillium macrosclerotiorum]|uniref:uncharacterized protein n=1 Tax=Penicillium macrosclerotiorum TaxID=303699 RepID=UPI002547AA02|nr:uncharacterized protein N7462_006623 [Penicillium macrosclerotiorum]KAJ5683458.1 hypothetical protein N7462_006623 [Penicillium macrosclerotiorum]